jgi:hypothetical protein
MEEFYELKKHVPWSQLTTEQIDDVIQHRLIAYYSRPSPHREGYVIERIADINNLRAADEEAQSGKVKHNVYIKRHNKNAEAELRQLQRMILELNFPDPDFKVDYVKTDAGKVREIVKQNYFPWRILHHAIMRIIGYRLFNAMIYDTFACIKGKGLHFGVRRAKMMIRRYQPRYFWQCDYRKYYQSIPHALVIRELRKMYKDEHFIKLIGLTLCSYKSDIDDLLNEEIDKRIHHRGIHFSAHRELCSQSD